MFSLKAKKKPHMQKKKISTVNKETKVAELDDLNGPSNSESSWFHGSSNSQINRMTKAFGKTDILSFQ